MKQVFIFYFKDYIQFFFIFIFIFPKVSRQEFEKTEGLLHKALNEWKKRKKIASDILGAIGEGSGQSNKALKEMIDFEDDNVCIYQHDELIL